MRSDSIKALGKIFLDWINRLANSLAIYFPSKFDIYVRLVLGLAKLVYSRQTYNLYLISASEYGGTWVSDVKKGTNTKIPSDCRRTVGRRGFGRADYWATNFETS